jgi:hypothetical protein
LDAAEPARTTSSAPQPQIAALLAAPPATPPLATPAPPLTALDVAIRKVNDIAVLAGWPDLKARLTAAVRAVQWASKVVPKTADAYPPPIKNALLVTRVKPGETPEFKTKLRNLNRFQSEAIAKQLPGMLTNGAWDVVEGDGAQCTSPLMAAPKYNEKGEIVSYRVCGDWRKANQFVIPDHELAPRVTDLTQLAMRGALRTIYDCANAYNQIACCAVTGTLYTVQATASIKIKPTRVHFGMKNGGSVCQRALHDALCTDGREDDPSCDNYSDEIIQSHKGGDATRPETDYAYLDASTDEVCNVLYRAAAAGVVLQADKWQPLTAEATLFNMVVGPGSCRLTTQRMQAIHAWPQPSTPSKLHTFLAMASHYRHHCPNFPHDSGRLRREVLRGAKLVWTAEAVATFERIRVAFRDASMLTAIDYDGPFIVKADASIDALSVSLFQPDPMCAGALVLVDCNGRATRPFERNYGPMDLEAAAVRDGLDRWPHLLVGGPHRVKVRSDNRALVDFWVNGAQINDPARANLRHRLIEKLQAYNLEWEWNPASENQWDDAISRADWRRDDVEHIALCEAMFCSPDDVLATTAARTAAEDGSADADAADPHTLAALHGEGSDDDSDEGEAESEGSEDETVEDPFPGEEAAPRAPPDAGTDAAPAQTAAPAPAQPTVAPTPPTPTLDAADDDDEPEPEPELDEPKAPPTATAAPEPPPTTPADAEAADAARREATAHMAATIDGDVTLTAEADSERRSWAAAQADDAALRPYFDAASGLRVGTRRIVEREPTTDCYGRLFIRFGVARGAERVRALLLVVPSSRMHELVAATHAAMSHRAPAAVANELRRTHWWPYMDRDIKRVIDGCMLCQAYTRAPRPTMPGSKYPAAARFQSVHVDFVPMPLATDEHGAQFNGFLLGVDRTTGMARSMPVRSKQGGELARVFERDWVYVLGPPNTVTADNALETRGKAWSAMCRKHAITPQSTTSYNKEANGLVERCVQTVKRGAIVATHNNGDRSWLSALPGIVYMCAVQPARGHVSPHELTYGAAPPSRTGAQLSPAAPVYEPAEGARIAATVRKDLEATTAAAALARAKEEATRAPEAVFKPGRIVWVENTENAVGGTAFAQRQKRHGPYIVDEVDADKPRVTLRVLATNRVVRDKLKGQSHNKYWVATRRLTLTVGDPARAGAGWLGVYDRGALPEGERAEQLKQDTRERRPPKAIGAARIRADHGRGVAVGNGKVAAVLGHFTDAVDGVRVIVLLANGLATDVNAAQYPALLNVARRDASNSAKKAAIRSAPKTLSGD